MVGLSTFETKIMYQVKKRGGGTITCMHVVCPCVKCRVVSFVSVPVCLGVKRSQVHYFGYPVMTCSSCACACACQGACNDSKFDVCHVVCAVLCVSICDKRVRVRKCARVGVATIVRGRVSRVGVRACYLPSSFFVLIPLLTHHCPQYAPQMSLCLCSFSHSFFNVYFFRSLLFCCSTGIHTQSK